MLADWKRLVAEVEFYGSDEVQATVAKLELTFDALENARLFQKSPPATALYAMACTSSASR
ncbi:hypothetical protein AB0N38_33800 [Micromonospora aurantiaca]|uniref:Uncharacterized protein n=1 Tax=Micromonospora aurantiaca (nom. illeg.) TaxID=47850 RepID=A0ABQ6UMW7_9ACTN|nr:MULTISPECIES: hypothetical protein [Micromonospora]KAB1118630.1 hypothetical protein F6X54_02580 [Micromonospora aurantiaca]MDG4752831.1 hypothetical protein [Micromonospora sp. WMMD718]